MSPDRSLGVHQGGEAIDITNADTPTMRDLLERDDPAGYFVTVGAYRLARSRILPATA